MAAETDSQRIERSGETQEVESFSSLLKQSFRPRNKEHETEVERSVSVLVEQALADQSLVKDDVLETIESMIAQLDKKLSDQMNEILHAAEFQKLESAWRGLKYLVYNSETDATLKVRVLNTSKDELRNVFKAYPGAKWDQSPLFQKIYTSEYSTLGGEPYGCLVGDFQFDQSPMDVSLLRDIGKIASASHAPFFAAAGSALIDIESWTQMHTKRDLGKVQDTPEYAAFKSLRDSEDARYLALCMPRVLARLPYGAKTEPVEEFAFEETTDGHNGEKYAWMNAAYAMATNINRAFKEYGWTIRIRGVASGGEVANLPAHIFPTDDGGIDMKCPTEVSIDDRREGELSKLGLIPLLHRKNTDKAAFIGAQSLYRPKKFVDDDATASDNLSSRITYMFAVSRFAHYLKVMVRDMVGQTKEKEQLQQELQSWISKYIDPQPKVSDEITKAKKPLADASIKVEEDEENPGYYRTIIKLRPHYQLEGMDIGLSLVSKMPKQS